MDASFKDLRDDEINVIDEMRASAGEISKKLASNKIVSKNQNQQHTYARPATSQNVGGRKQKNRKPINL